MDLVEPQLLGMPVEVKMEIVFSKDWLPLQMELEVNKIVIDRILSKVTVGVNAGNVSFLVTYSFLVICCIIFFVSLNFSY